MNWYNLLKNKCPKCSKSIAGYYHAATDMFECACGFKISQQRYKEIVTDQSGHQLRREAENHHES